MPLLLICCLWNILLLGVVSVVILKHAQARDALLAMSSDGAAGFFRLTLTVLAAALCGAVNWHMLRRVQMLVFPLPPKALFARDGSPSRPPAKFFDAIVGPAKWLVTKESIKSAKGTLTDAYSLSEEGVARHLARTVASLPLISLAAVLVTLSQDIWFGVSTILSLFVFIGGPVAIVVAASDNTAGRVVRYFSRTLAWCGVVYVATLVPTLAGSSWAPTITLVGHGLCAWILWVGLYSVALARRSTEAEHELPDDSIWNALTSPLVLGGRWTGWVPLVACALLLVILGLIPAWAAAIGPLAIILAGATFWGCLGSVVVMAVYTLLRLKPKLWAVVVAAAGVLVGSMLFAQSDKRLMRTIAGSNAMPELRSVREAAELWPEDRTLVLVAAEGGGIYAAYHSAQVLGYLEDAKLKGTNFSFGDHVFAISGVSGGSIGATVYAGLLRVKPLSFAETSDAILSHDLLSAVLAAAVGRDLVPLPIEWLDRTRALEDALIDAWGDAVPDRPSLLAQPLWTLDPVSNDLVGPYLFLNVTSVSTGEPRFSGPLRFKPPNNDPALLSHVHANIREDIEGLNLSSATATVLSARFPVVTTSGQALTDTGVRMSYVDGGYFENSGCATLEQIYNVIRSVRPQQRIIVVRIGAEPEDLPQYGWGDLMSPVATLANTRGSHGRNVRRRFKEMIRDDQNADWVEILLRLNVKNHEIPLGWLLSEQSRSEIRSQVEQSQGAECVIGGLLGGF